MSLMPEDIYWVTQKEGYVLLKTYESYANKNFRKIAGIIFSIVFFLCKLISGQDIQYSVAQLGSACTAKGHAD